MTGEKSSTSCALSHHPCLKIALLLLSLLLAIYLFAISRNAFRSYDYIGKNPENSVNMMSFSAEGKVVGKPDIALIDMGFVIEKKNVADAQKESTETMNSFIDRVKGLGVLPKDIRTTNYNIYPQYNWNEGKQSLRGYQVSQNVQIKIRDLSKISDILALAGEFGLNQVGSLQFDIDNKDGLIAQAREEAIKKAQKKAQDTAKSLGISLGKITSFSEGMFEPPQIYNGYMGRKAMATEMVMDSSPTIESGSAEITVNVTISYEVR